MSKLRDLASKGYGTFCKLSPIKKNRIVFSSFNGGGYSDSPKAICEVLRKSGEDLELLWICKDEKAAATLPEGVKPIPYQGMKKIRALTTAKVWVDNCRKYENLKRKKQIYMQTWHGFALKKIEQDAEAGLEPAYLAACKTDSAQIDVIVSGSKYMTKLYREKFWYHGAVLETGTPRNDIFYQDQAALHAKVCQALGLPEDRKLALYAPTFRGDKSTDAYQLDARLAYHVAAAAQALAHAEARLVVVEAQRARRFLEAR